MSVRFECPVCGHKMIQQGVLRNRQIQTWACGSVNEAHEVVLRLRGEALVKENKPK